MRIRDWSSDVCSSDLERSNLSVNREVDTGWTPETSCGSAASLTLDAPVPQRRFYVPVRIKFCLSLLIALTGTGLSVWLSLPWVVDLGRLLGRPLALGLITFIASVPGFMHAFLISPILMDRRPVRRVPMHYPSVTVLVACYNEGGNI